MTNLSLKSVCDLRLTFCASRFTPIQFSDDGVDQLYGLAQGFGVAAQLELLQSLDDEAAFFVA